MGRAIAAQELTDADRARARWQFEIDQLQALQEGCYLRSRSTGPSCVHEVQVAASERRPEMVLLEKLRTWCRKAYGGRKVTTTS